MGNAQPNLIIVSRDLAGTVAITGGTPTVANTTLIQIFGRAGEDQLGLDETNGALPKANLFGEADNDDVLFGGLAAWMTASSRIPATTPT